MKKRISLLALVAVLLSLLGCSSINSTIGTPKELAERACTGIYGYHDAELVLALMPIQQGTDLYDTTYEKVKSIVADAPFSDSFNVQGEYNLKTYDGELYDECIDFLSEIGVEKVSQIHLCTCGVKFQDGTEQNINIIVAKIGKQWKLIECLD